MSDNEEKIINIKQEGDILSVEGVGEFEAVTSTLFLKVDNLQISNALKDFSDENDPKPPVFHPIIKGFATVERDKGLGVIGYEETYTNKIALDIQGLSEDELIKVHDKRQKLRKDGNGKKKFFDFSGSEKLYTYSMIGFSPANWEFDTEDLFFSSIYLPAKIMEELLKMVRENTIGGLSVGLDMDGFYTDDKVAFMNRPIRFYLVPDEKDVSLMSSSSMRSPSVANGFVSALNILENKRNLSVLDTEPLSIIGGVNESSNETDNVLSFPQEYLKELKLLTKAVIGMKKGIWALALVVSIWILTTV